MVYMFMPPTHAKIFLLISFTPSFIFFSAYLIILFRWYVGCLPAYFFSHILCRAQIYHNSYEMTSLRYDHLRIIFYLVNAAMYITVIALCIFKRFRYLFIYLSIVILYNIYFKFNAYQLYKWKYLKHIIIKIEK